MHRVPYSVSWAPGQTAVLTLPSAINLATSGRIYLALARALIDGATVIIADMTETRSCDYAAVNVLASIQARAAAAGTKLRVAAAAPQLRRMLETADSGPALDIYPDLTTALSGSRAAGDQAHRPRRPRG